MTLRKISIGLLGLGTVGSGVLKILREEKKLLEERTGMSFEIKKVLVRSMSKKRSLSLPKNILCTRPSDILEDPGIDILVEAMGGMEPARSLILKALQSGKHVVTANKALLAQEGSSLFAAAQKAERSIGFEASVAGGIPIVQSIQSGFVGNRVEELYGIINGTCNFILSEMSEHGGDFKDVLSRAQQEGYAESDPSFDIEGTDAAQKLTILLSLCHGLPCQKEVWKKVFVEGISHITSGDIEYARQLGYAIKLLAISKICADTTGQASIEARVHPTMIPLHHPLADVRGVFNAIYLKGSAVGDAMFLGRGAGSLPTASAVVSDIVMAAKNMRSQQQCGDLRTQATPQGTTKARFLQKAKSLASISDLESEYYLRFSAVDKPGVFGRIAQHLGKHKISIADVSQRQRNQGSQVPIIVMTHKSREADIQKALREIDRLDCIGHKTNLIRVQRFS